MAARKTQPAPEPVEPTVQDFSDESLCQHHMPRDESDTTAFKSIRASLGAEGFQHYLMGEIQRRAWLLPSKLSEGGVEEVERLEYFVAALRKELSDEG